MILQGERAALLAFKDEAAPFVAAFFWQEGGLTVLPKPTYHVRLHLLAEAYPRLRRHKLKKIKTLWEV